MPKNDVLRIRVHQNSHPENPCVPVSSRAQTRALEIRRLKSIPSKFVFACFII